MKKIFILWAPKYISRCNGEAIMQDVGRFNYSPRGYTVAVK